MRRLLAYAAAGLACLFAVPAVAAAATLAVTTTSDSDDGACTGSLCSLRDAIKYSLAGDTVLVPASTNHYVVTLGEITLDHWLTIQGATTGTSVIDAGRSSRVFHATVGVGSGNTITFQDLTITGGRTTSAPGGGGILIDPFAGNLTLVNVNVARNSVNLAAVAQDDSGGGGIYNSGGATTITGGSVSNNNAVMTDTGTCCQGGGGLYQNGGSISITGADLSNDTATITGPSTDSANGMTWDSSGGGAIYDNGNSSATTAILNSVFDLDNAQITSGDQGQGGGALFVGRSATSGATLSGDTFFGDTVTVNGPGGQSAGAHPGTLHCCAGGGAVQSFAGLTVDSSTFSKNSVTVNEGDCCQGGGAIEIESGLRSTSISLSTLSANTFTTTSSGCCNGGGAVQDDTTSGFAGTETVTASTISANSATFTGSPSLSGGGGFYENTGPTVNYVNSTISDNATNSIRGGGGGVYLLLNGTANLANVTIADNSAFNGAGGGVLLDASGGGTATLATRNSIIGQNSARSARDCFGTGANPFVFDSLGYNLDRAPDTCHFTATGDRTVSSLGLGPLANNAGATQTQALLATSPAVDAGNPSGCTDPAGNPLTTDQRGFPRPSGVRCDSGAYELQQGRPSATGVTCRYSVATFSDTCAAVVLDTGAPPAASPTGTVHFTAAGGGSFPSGSSCQLVMPSSISAPSCAVSFVPPATGGPVLTATYLGDLAHHPSSGSVSPTITTLGNGLVIASVAVNPSTITFRLRVPALVQFTVQRAVPGRRGRGGRCVRPNRHNRGHAKCTIWAPVPGSIALIGHTGRNRFRFRGRIGGRKLRPDGYRLLGTPSILGVVGRPTTKRFHIR